VLVNSGTLKFLNSPTIGALTVGGLGTAELDATTTLGALTLNGSGTISGSGTVTVTGPATLTGTPGMSGAGKTVFAGGVTFSSLTILSGRTVENQATALWTGSQLVINGTFLNDAGAVLNSTVDGGVMSGSGTFTNNGTLLKSGGTGTTSIGTIFGTPAILNNGSIEIDSGTLQFAKSLENAGTIKIAAAATLGVTGNLKMDATSVLDILLSSAGTGLLNVSGAVTIAGTLVTLPPPNFAPTVGSRFKFAAFASQSGGFASVQEGALTPGEALSLDTNVAGQLNLDVVSA